MTINPRFIVLMSEELAKIGTTLFNMGQIHAAMHKADDLLATESAVVGFAPDPETPAEAEADVIFPEAKASDTEFASSLDELATAETTETVDETPGTSEEAPKETVTLDEGIARLPETRTPVDNTNGLTGTQGDAYRGPRRGRR